METLSIDYNSVNMADTVIVREEENDLSQGNEGSYSSCNNCTSIITSEQDVRECRVCKKLLCISCKELQTKIEFMINGPTMKECHSCKILADIKNVHLPVVTHNEDRSETTVDQNKKLEAENVLTIKSNEKIQGIADEKDSTLSQYSYLTPLAKLQENVVDNFSSSLSSENTSYSSKPISEVQDMEMDTIATEIERATTVSTKKNFSNKLLYSKIKKRGHVPIKENKAELDPSNIKSNDEQKTKEHLKTLENLTEENKDTDKNIRVTRQESTRSLRGRKKKVSKHVCAGCGRRDCDGQFMKLLREMILTAKKNKFEIRNVVPDGNCMFAAIVDQLELAGCHDMYSAVYLRQEAVNYLRAHPESEDGTHYTMFMDGENWEEYLTRMSREGQWGDHLMLKALSKVTGRDIKVLSGSENRGFTDIKYGVDESTLQPLVLGHVGELHYVSLRPASAEDLAKDVDDEIDEEEVMVSLTPQYIDMEKKQMFLEDYVDPYSDTPGLHLGYLIKKILPPSNVLSEADRFVSTALSLEYMDDETNDSENRKTRDPLVFTLKTIGDITNGLYVGQIESNTSESADASPWTDVVVLQVLNSITTLEPGIEPRCKDEVRMETSLVHPGYTRLVCALPCSKDDKKNDTGTFYYPNAYETFQALKLTDEEKRQRASQYGSQIVSLFSDYKGAIRCLFWPEEAKEWTERVRPTGWPSETLIQSIISNGCHLVAEPHPNSTRPDIEFRISFGGAENSLCEEGLSRDQRYCYIAFKALCYQELKDVPFINSLHLRSIFFHACERIQAECWTSKLGGCIFYLIDCLIGDVNEGCIPCYFIRENNLISHLTEAERNTVLQKLENLRSQPLQHFMSFKMAMDETEAMHVLENIRDDIENNFLQNYSVRKSVLECFVPMSIDMAKRNIEKKGFKKALDEVQAAYEERLTIATCEDNLPFLDFLNEVVSTVDYNLQWWFLLFADEKLGTTLSCDLSMSNEPIAIEDLVGDEVAKEYKSTLIPRRLASYQCTFFYDFSFYLFMKYRTTQAVSCLQLCIERHGQVLYCIQQAASMNEEEKKNTSGDFTDRNMLKIFVFLYLCCSRLRKYGVIGQYLPAYEALCARLGTREPYFQLSLVYESLGYDEDYKRIISQFHQLPSGNKDIIKLVTQDVMSQTTTF